MVEVRYAFACEFEVLGLVFADWDVCCSVLAVSASCRSDSFCSHLSPLILKRGTHTYEPKYPLPVKPDTRKAPVSTSLSSHQADSRRLLSRVYSVPISPFPLLSLFPSPPFFSSSTPLSISHDPNQTKQNPENSPSTASSAQDTPY